MTDEKALDFMQKLVKSVKHGKIREEEAFSMLAIVTGVVSSRDELVDMLRLPQSTVDYRLRKFRKAGWISVEFDTGKIELII